MSRNATEPSHLPRAEVVGLGLIGTSIGLALRAAGWHVTGSDLNQRRAARAHELGAVDELGSDPAAQLAIIATPVTAIADAAAALMARSSNDELVVTDVGGVKSPVVAAIADPRFVGGHPMAGSEQTGPDGASGDLFQGATWVLTPTTATDPGAFQQVRALVGSLGADAIELTPERHDAIVAVVSHVPHLAAANLMVLASRSADEHGALVRLAAGGFRDMTRIAAGDPGIWPDIFRDNADAVVEVLDGLIARLGAARELVVRHDREGLFSLLGEAQVARRNLPSRVVRPETLFECRVPVPDRPGVLAEVTTVLGGLGVNIFDLEFAHSIEGDSGVMVLAIDEGDVEKARVALTDLGYRPSLVRLG